IQRREWIGTWVSEVRIGEASGRIRDGDLCAPRWIVRETRVEEQVRRVVEDTPRRADAGAFVAVRRPDQTDARRELRLLPERRPVARVPGIARERQPGRRLRVNRAVDVLIERAALE